MNHASQNDYRYELVVSKDILSFHNGKSSYSGGPAGFRYHLIHLVAPDLNRVTQSQVPPETKHGTIKVYIQSFKTVKDDT